MIRHRLYVIIILFITLVVVTPYVFSQRSDKSSLFYGLNISPVYNFHYTDISGLPPISFCCTDFTLGKAFGANISLFAQYLVNKNQGLRTQFGYRTLNSHFSTYSTIPIPPKQATINQILDIDLSSIYFEGSYIYNLSKRSSISLGIVAGITANKNYSYYEEIVSPVDVLFSNGKTIRNASKGAIPGFNPRYLALSAGIFQRFPINTTNTVFITPSIHYWYGIRPTVYALDWYIHSLNLGFTIDYFPNGEPQYPNDTIEVKAPTMVSQIVNTKPSLSLSLIDTAHCISSISSTTYPIIHSLFYSKDKPEYFSRLETSIKDSLNVTNKLYLQGLDSIIVVINQQKSNITLITHSNAHTAKEIKQIQKQAMGFLTKRGMNDKYIQDSVSNTINFPSNEKYREGIEDNLRVDIFSEHNKLPYVITFYDTIVRIVPSKISITFDNNIGRILEWGILDALNSSIVFKGGSLHNDTSLEVPIYNKTEATFIVRIIYEDILGVKSIIEDSLNVPIKKSFNDSSKTIFIMFPYGSAELSKGYLTSLQSLFKDFNKNIPVQIDSYTDSFGEELANKKLVIEREQAVLSIIKPTLFQRIQYPLTNHWEAKNPENRFFNRTVKISIKMP